MVSGIPISQLFVLSIYLPNPLLSVGCNIRSTFKWSKAGLSSKFSFTKTDCLTQAKSALLFFHKFGKN